MSKSKSPISSTGMSHDSYPEPDGHPSYHRPRRNYWGNLLEEDTYHEEFPTQTYYDYSDQDAEDDHDSYYTHQSYD